MHLLTAKSSDNGFLKNLDKADDPSTFTLPSRMVADVRLNDQNQFFDLLSQIISLLEYEWVRPENSDLCR
jgi:hypothetical protein